jgi:hypothetical protein
MSLLVLLGSRYYQSCLEKGGGGSACGGVAAEAPIAVHSLLLHYLRSSPLAAAPRGGARAALL